MKFLGPLQMRIMQIIWYSDEDYMKARVIMEILNKDTSQPKLAYTTINTVLASLCKYRFIQRVMTKRSYTYIARTREDQYESDIMDYCAAAFHNGDFAKFGASVRQHAMQRGGR